MEENPKEPAIIDAAAEYKEICRRRAKLSKDEKAALETLKIVMAEKGYTEGYHHGNWHITLEKTSKPKVRLDSDKPPPKKKAKKAGSDDAKE